MNNLKPWEKTDIIFLSKLFFKDENLSLLVCPLICDQFDTIWCSTVCHTLNMSSQVEMNQQHLHTIETFTVNRDQDLCYFQAEQFNVFMA